MENFRRLLEQATPRPWTDGDIDSLGFFDASCDEHDECKRTREGTANASLRNIATLYGVEAIEMLSAILTDRRVYTKWLDPEVEQQARALLAKIEEESRG